MPPIEQAAALADRLPIDDRIAKLNERVAELRATVDSLQARLDSIRVTERRDR